MKFQVELSERHWSRICVALDFYNRHIPNRRNEEIKAYIYDVMGRTTCVPVKPPDERKGGEITL